MCTVLSVLRTVVLNLSHTFTRSFCQILFLREFLLTGLLCVTVLLNRAEGARGQTCCLLRSHAAILVEWREQRLVYETVLWAVLVNFQTACCRRSSFLTQAHPRGLVLAVSGHFCPCNFILRPLGSQIHNLYKCKLVNFIKILIL